MKKCSILIALPLLWSCANMDYDISKGIDNEYTLFSDEISVPVGDIGPVSLGILLDGTGFRETINEYVKEDEDGFLVVEKEDNVYQNFVMFFSMMLPDPSLPVDFPVGSCSKSIETMASALTGIGVSLTRQSLSLYGTNPLTEDISISGKLSLMSEAGDETPAIVLASEEFSQVPVSAEAQKGDLLQVVSPNEKAFYECELENLMLHLPGSLMEKDPLSGLGVISLGYQYKSYLSLGNDFSLPFSFTIDNINLQLGQYKVKEATVCTEVSNEIPFTLTVDSVEVLVAKTLEDGTTADEVYENVGITPGLVIASGSKGYPTLSPLEIVIGAREGTIPDISGLRINFTIGPPTGEGDTRIGLNQNVFFNNLRATVSGGITIQGL